MFYISTIIYSVRRRSWNFWETDREKDRNSIDKQRSLGESINRRTIRGSLQPFIMHLHKSCARDKKAPKDLLVRYLFVHSLRAFRK